MNVDFKHKTVLLIIWCGGLITELKLISRFGYLPRCPIPPVEPEFIANMDPPRIFSPVYMLSPDTICSMVALKCRGTSVPFK